MSSVNPHYTFHYSQPAEYRFSHDSVFLARRVFEILSGRDLGSGRCLDLCAGAGVIGMDFLFHRRAASQSTPADFDFLEIQEIYRPHFAENAARLGAIPSALHFLQCNYEELQRPSFAERYDLILCNPPYFLPGQGKLSPSEFKNRCRFFIDSDLSSLLLGVAASLKPTGEAFLLLRDLPEHGWNVIGETEKICAGRLTVDILGDIRGTHFVRMRPLTERAK